MRLKVGPMHGLPMYPVSVIIIALLAQSAPAPDNPEAKAQAQALLKEGANHYDQGDLATAIEKFEQAYAAYPSPKLLFNIGQAARGLGRLDDAMDAFSRFLQDDGEAAADMRAEALTQVAQLQSKLARLQVRCEVVDADISLDGKPVGKAPLKQIVWAMPGSHELTAQHPRMRPDLKRVEALAGTVLSVSLAPEPVAKPEAKPALAALAGLPEISRAEPSQALQVGLAREPPRTRGWWLGRKWTWVAASSAVIFAGGATAFGLSMQSKYDSLDRSCGKGSASPDGAYLGCSPSAVDAATFRKNMANTFWGLTGAAAICAGVLFVVEGRAVEVAPMTGEATGLVARTTY
jgi:hypothetical protein